MILFIKRITSYTAIFFTITGLFYGGYICGKYDSPPYKDRIYLPNCTDKHYIVVGTGPSEINPKGISVFSNNGETIVMSPDKETTKKILDAVDKAVWGVK